MSGAEKDVKKMPENGSYYTIGEASQITHISKKTLRFYEKIGLIQPDYVDQANGYRYYSRQTLLMIPIIKYYKQMGFKLEEMRDNLASDSYAGHEESFLNKIGELRAMEQDIHVARRSVSDWYQLIVEANNVLINNAVEVSVKYQPSLTTCYLEQPFDNDYRAAIINIDWTNYLEDIGNAITGPVMLYFPNVREKLEGRPTTACILQEILRSPGEHPTITVGGAMMISCYHIGCHDTIAKTYEKMYRWADRHGYQCADSSLERYVTDYWTLNNEERFVTEVLIQAER